MCAAQPGLLLLLYAVQATLYPIQSAIESSPLQPLPALRGPLLSSAEACGSHKAALDIMSTTKLDQAFASTGPALVAPEEPKPAGSCEFV